MTKDSLTVGEQIRLNKVYNLYYTKYKNADDAKIAERLEASERMYYFAVINEKRDILMAYGRVKALRDLKKERDENGAGL